MMKKTALLLTFLCLLTRTALAFTVEHEFTVLLGPFDASRTRFSYSLKPGDYSVNSAVRTNGFFDTLYPFKANYATTGKIKNNNLQTGSYHYDSQSRFSKRSRELVYDDKGRAIYRLSTKNDKSKKVEIEQNADNNGTTELQTVFAELARQYNQVRFCDSRHQVFDGKRRYDVIFKDEGQENIMANDYTSLAGNAAKCSMYIDKLGAKGDDLLWELTQDRPIYFWILEDNKTRKPFIARIMIEDTPLGRLQVYTSHITVTN